jgi:hypothetical protein
MGGADPGSVDSFAFLSASVAGATRGGPKVYTDTVNDNDTSNILSNKSQWCSATTEKTDSLNKFNSQNVSSTTKVPKTGYSPLITSLMIISTGATFAGGLVFAINKLKK